MGKLNNLKEIFFEKTSEYLIRKSLLYYKSGFKTRLNTTLVKT